MPLKTVTQIAKELGVSVSTAYRQVEGLEGVKRGRSTLYDLDAKGVNISKDDSLDYTELGSTAYRRWGSTIAEERLRQLRGREGRILLREMRMNDPVIGAVFLAIENSMQKISWRIKPASEQPADIECADFVQQCMDDMSFSWNDTLQFILGMLEQGFSCLEVVMKRRLGNDPKDYIEDPAKSTFNDGRIGWRKWSPRPAESLCPGREWILDINGGIHGIRQLMMWTTGQVIEIPIERLLLFRTTVAPSNSPEGVPIHRPAFVPWYMCQSLEEMEGIGIERDLAGIPVIYMGADTKKRGGNNDFDQAKEIVTNLRKDDQAGVVFPYPKLGTAGDNRGILLELLSSTSRRNYNTSEIIGRYDRRKALAMLAQFIMLGLETTGSFALSKSQSDIFSTAVTAWAINIANTINRFAIPKLIEYNVFPQITGMPKLIPSDIGIPDLQEMAIYVNSLVGSGVIKPDVELERHLRQVAHLPQRDENQEVSSEQITDKSIVRGAHLAKIITALRLLQEKGEISEEEVQKIIEGAKNELLDTLGDNNDGKPGNSDNTDEEA